LQSDIGAARNFLTNLTRTIAFYEPGSATVVSSQQFYATYRHVAGSNVFSEPDYGTPVIATEINDIGTNALDSFSGLLAREDLIWIRLTTAGWTNNQPVVNYNVYEARDRYAETCVATLTLPYPCDYALTNGYVSRVRIFAVCGNLPNVSLSPVKASLPTDAELVSYEHQSMFPAHSALLYGLDLNLQTMPEFPAADQAAEFNFSVSANTGTKVTLLADSSAPTARVPFSVGSETITSAGFGNAHGFQDRCVSVEINSPPHLYGLQKNKTVRMIDGVQIFYFVVVADWNWKHCNDAHPYEPTPYTPPWATNTVPQ
jgi:hypothetical protein